MFSKMGWAIGAALLTLALSTPASSDQKDKDAQLKISLDQLKDEVIVLERQVRAMQETLDRNGGQMNALITQIIDNVTAIRQAQGRVNEGSVSAITQVNGLGERLSATNERIDRLSGQMAELKKLVENLPKLPTFTEITPGNPDQLFAAAYGDYSRGNYPLAISEFQQYVNTYPTSEMASHAQYWLGECYFAHKDYARALEEFGKVPKGDKAAAAKFKRGMTLIQLGQPDAARAEFTFVIRTYPKSNEATLARQQLGEVR